MLSREDIGTGVVIACALVLIVAFITLVTSCAALRTPEAAEDAYKAALLRCTASSKTLAESRQCELWVDREWGVADGGHE